MLNDFNPVGLFVVSLFFFISGYGQEFKRERHEGISLTKLPLMIWKQFYPLIIPSVIYISLLFLYQGMTTDQVIDKVCRYGLILPYTWFVLTLWILYIIFYVACSLTDKYKYVVVITAVGIVVSTLLMAHWKMQSTYHMCNFAFLGGVIYREMDRQGRFKIEKKWIMLLLFIAYFMLSLIVYIDKPIWNSLCIRLFSFALPMLVAIMVSNIKTKESRIIKFLSKISYELYICQGITFILVPQSIKEFVMVYIVLVAIITIVIAFCSKSITNLLFLHNK